MLEFIEEALDEIAFAVEREIARPLGLAVGLGRDDRSDSPLGEFVDEGIGVVGLVATLGQRSRSTVLRKQDREPGPV